jgi:hypothetical protein
MKKINTLTAKLAMLASVLLFISESEDIATMAWTHIAALAIFAGAWRYLSKKGANNEN